MINFSHLVFSFLVLSQLFPFPIFAEPATKPTSGSWSTSGTYSKLRESGVKAYVEGNILSTEEFTPGAGMEPGMQVKLATPTGDLMVHVGPRWFILENDVNFTRGEPMTVIGVKINFEKKPVLLADEIVKGEKKLILRDLATPKSTRP